LLIRIPQEEGENASFGEEKGEDKDFYRFDLLAKKGEKKTFISRKEETNSTEGKKAAIARTSIMEGVAGSREEKESSGERFPDIRAR